MAENIEKQSSSSENGEKTEGSKRFSFKIMRHGERTFDGLLSDYGREVTKEKARANVLPDGIDIVKAIGSPSGPINEESGVTKPRALETADIYVHEFADATGAEQYKTRPKSELGFDTLQTTEPFSWNAYYKEIAEKTAQEKYSRHFAELSDEQKADAANVAQNASVKRLLEDENGHEHVHEIACRIAYAVDKYARMSDRLDPDTNVLYVGGTHGGMIEPFLKEALARTDAEGGCIRGFDDLDEIGGAFRPSEAFTMNIETESNGEKKIAVTFDNAERQKIFNEQNLSLDIGKVRELAEEYIAQHGIKFNSDK
jgi:hypothetical protein